MVTSNSRNSSWQRTWWARALGVAVLVGLSLTSVEAQEAYRRETRLHLRNASVELAKQSPDFHKVFDNLDAAVSKLQRAIALGALDGEQGAAWIDRVTAIAGQVASDELDDAGSREQINARDKNAQRGNAQRKTLDESVDATQSKELLVAGDAARADGEYRKAIGYYRQTLPTLRQRGVVIPSFSAR